jgi:hypothetical protein
MANFTHVQFISWEVYAGPNRGPRPWPINRATPGLTIPDPAGDNCFDIEAHFYPATIVRFEAPGAGEEKREVRFLC